MKKTIFITGASRGLGRIWTETFLKRGDNVVATVRNTDSLKELAAQFPENLLVLQLDVTDRKAAFETVTKAKSHFGVIDVLINNAGYEQIGAVEELEEQEIRGQFETNVFGSIWTTQAIIPIMREQKSGHIIQISSVLGLISFPIVGLYSATKYAIEGLTESLAAEVAGFGIKVSLVEPNGYETDFNGSSAFISKSLPEYDAVKASLQEGNKPEDWGVPSATAAAMIKLVDAENPPLRILFGKAAVRWANHAYSERLKTWEDWKDVSEAAHGK